VRDISNAGGAVTFSVATAVFVLAASVASEMTALVWYVPDAVEAMSTVAATAWRGVPAGIGVTLVEVQVSVLLPLDNAHVQPVGAGAAAKVSPVGSVTTSLGS
jgi:hypothetical protein